jgi:chromosome partitioning protein
LIVSIASHKGGVGKTTTAIHLAALLQRRAPTLLIDGDVNRSALAWAKRGEARGNPLPFKVVDEKAAAKWTRDYDSIVVDSAAHPSRSDLAAMVEASDLLIIISEPEIMSLDVLPDMLEDLAKLKSDKHRILLCQVSPRSEAAEAKALLEQLNAPTFKRHIRSYAAVKMAALRGTTVDNVPDEYAGDAWKDYQAVAKEIL